MSVNEELIVDILAHIELDPSTWDQANWARAWEGDEPPQLATPIGVPEIIDPLAPPCGTAFCFAGWACVIKGDRLDWNRGYGEAVNVLSEVNLETYSTTIEHRAGFHIDPEDRRDLYILFDADNELEDLYRLSALLIAGKSLDPDDGDDSGDETGLRDKVSVRVTELKTLRLLAAIKKEGTE